MGFDKTLEPGSDPGPGENMKQSGPAYDENHVPGCSGISRRSQHTCDPLLNLVGCFSRCIHNGEEKPKEHGGRKGEKQERRYSESKSDRSFVPTRETGGHGGGGVVIIR